MKKSKKVEATHLDCLYKDVHPQVLTNHLQSVTALRWSGEGLLYSASQDRTIKVWRASDVRTYLLCVVGHALLNSFLSSM